MRTKVGGFWALLALVQSTFAATHYVDLHSTNPIPPYTNWATAATNIQEAVDVATGGDEVVATNGTYGPVEVAHAIHVRSVNGTACTIIDGGAFLAAGASLSGFTVTNGFGDPGGVRCQSVSEVVSNCVLCGNVGGFGGGANGGTLISCAISNNFGNYGGGASGASLIDCVVSGNSSDTEGGGVESCTLTNCLLIGNTVTENPSVGPPFGGGAWGSTLIGCTLIGNSVNGPKGDDVDGGGAFFCTMIGCLIISNSASWEGGGVCGCFLTDCLLRGNSAPIGGGASGSVLTNCELTDNLAEWGGGAYASTLSNSLLTRNSAESSNVSAGGGAANCTLNNCTLADNSVDGQTNPYTWGGGGAYDSRLSNSILYFNTASSNGANYDVTCLLNNCCTIPMPTNGFGNVTNLPLFVDLANGNLRLQSSSPCINAGNNAYAPTSPDPDGHRRIAGGTVDIGAYEFQTPTSIISYAWLQRYGLPTNGSADFTDPDGDGLNNWQEWRCGTDPTDPTSVLRLLSPTVTKTNVFLSWQSVAGVNYFLQRSTNGAPPCVFTTVATNILGQPGTTAYWDPNPPGPGPCFYRIGVP